VNVVHKDSFGNLGPVQGEAHGGLHQLLLVVDAQRRGLDQLEAAQVLGHVNGVQEAKLGVAPGNVGANGDETEVLSNHGTLGVELAGEATVRGSGAGEVDGGGGGLH